MRCGWKQVWASVENRMAGRRETVPSPACSLAEGAGEWQRLRVDGDHIWVVQHSRQEGKVPKPIGPNWLNWFHWALDVAQCSCGRLQFWWHCRLTVIRLSLSLCKNQESGKMAPCRQPTRVAPMSFAHFPNFLRFSKSYPPNVFSRLPLFFNLVNLLKFLFSQMFIPDSTVWQSHVDFEINLFHVFLIHSHLTHQNAPPFFNEVVNGLGIFVSLWVGLLKHFLFSLVVQNHPRNLVRAKVKRPLGTSLYLLSSLFPFFLMLTDSPSRHTVTEFSCLVTTYPPLSLSFTLFQHKTGQMNFSPRISFPCSCQKLTLVFLASPQLHPS